MSGIKPAIVIDLERAKDDYTPKPDHDPLGETPEMAEMTHYTCPKCNAASGLVGSGAFDVRYMLGNEHGVDILIICKRCAASGGYTDVNKMSEDDWTELK
jgi:hypothetical protein